MRMTTMRDTFRVYVSLQHEGENQPFPGEFASFEQAETACWDAGDRGYLRAYICQVMADGAELEVGDGFYFVNNSAQPIGWREGVGK